MKEIPLTQGYIALVDDEDFEHLSKFKWGITISKNHVYAQRQIEPRLMHRLLMNAPKGVLIDHKDTNSLNNQKHNLRFANKFQNGQNRPANYSSLIGYKGVTWNKKERVFNVKIGVENKRVHLGSFTDVVLAAKAYDEAAKKYHGEFAYLNFPDR